MAIKRSKPKPILPERYAAQARLAMYNQTLRDKYGEIFDAIKGEMFEAIKADEDVTLQLGKSFAVPGVDRAGNPCTVGKVRWQSRSAPQVDLNAIVQALADGKITQTVLLTLVSKWDAEALETLLPAAVISTKECPSCNGSGALPENITCDACEGTGKVPLGTEYGVVSANPEFKSQILEQYDEQQALLARLAEEESEGVA